MHSGHTGDVDNFAATLRDHDFADGLGKKECAGQIGLDNFVPLLQSHLFRWRAPGCAGVIDQNVDTAKFLLRRFRHGANAGRIFHVASQSQGFYAELRQFLGGLYASLFFASTQNQVGAHLCKAFRHLATKTNGTTGDHRDSRGKIKHLILVHAPRLDCFASVAAII